MISGAPRSCVIRRRDCRVSRFAQVSEFKVPLTWKLLYRRRLREVIGTVFDLKGIGKRWLDCLYSDFNLE